MESEDKRKIREMEETIRMKNKQIHQLLEDVEEVCDKTNLAFYIIQNILNEQIGFYYYKCFVYLFYFQVERDGNVCREKVVDLRDKLSEATIQMNAMAGEYAAVKVNSIWRNLGHKKVDIKISNL